MHQAVLKGYKEVIELLIAKGADVNAKIKLGITPLMNAVYKGHEEIVDLLIAKDADVNAMTEDGWTPLGLAIQLKRTEVADILRKHGGKKVEESKVDP